MLPALVVVPVLVRAEHEECTDGPDPEEDPEQLGAGDPVADAAPDADADDIDNDVDPEREGAARPPTEDTDEKCSWNLDGETSAPRMRPYLIIGAGTGERSGAGGRGTSGGGCRGAFPWPSTCGFAPVDEPCSRR